MLQLGYPGTGVVVRLTTARIVAAPLASAVYEGAIRHRRHVPHRHEFQYRMAQLYLDLDEVDRVFDRRWLWSARRRNLAEFRRTDYLATRTPNRWRKPCAGSVFRATGQRPARTNPACSTHLRYFGFAFNPVSFYYCHAADGETLECIVAEITNTPWRERHAYVLPVERGAQRRGQLLHWTFAKAFHVSPFLPHAIADYRWRSRRPATSCACT